MPVPPYRRITGHSRLQSDVENASQQYGSGDINVSQSGGGLQITDGVPRPIWGVINAHPNVLINAYGYTRVDDGTGDGTYPVLAGTTETGDGDVFGGNLIAWEVNGRLDVPTDGTVKVQLTPNRLGPGFTFLYATPAAASGSCSGSIPACCGPGPGIFPDSESIPTHPAYHPYQVTDTQCIAGILHVLKERHRDVWNKDICEVVDDYFDPKVTEAGCCDCPSGSASGSTPTVPCIPYSQLCITYSGGTGVCACINGLKVTMDLTTGSIENITWQGTINTTPVALTCTGGVWTLSHLEPETASSCEVSGGSGETFFPPSLPFTITLTGMEINGTACGDITATITQGPCEAASGSTGTCGFCDTYIVGAWTELYTGIIHPAETLHRNTTAYPGTACCWQSANYTMFTARDGFVLYNATNIELAECGWNSPVWDGNGCADFTGTTIGACQTVTVCCGESGSASGSASGSLCVPCQPGTPVTGSSTNCSGAPVLTLGTTYNTVLTATAMYFQFAIAHTNVDHCWTAATCSMSLSAGFTGSNAINCGGGTTIVGALSNNGSTTMAFHLAPTAYVQISVSGNVGDCLSFTLVEKPGGC